MGSYEYLKDENNRITGRFHYKGTYFDAHRDFLEKNHPDVFDYLYSNSKLDEYLYMVSNIVYDREEELTEAMMREEGITNELLETNPTRWKSKLDMIDYTVEAIVKREVVNVLHDFE